MQRSLTHRRMQFGLMQVSASETMGSLSPPVEVTIRNDALVSAYHVHEYDRSPDISMPNPGSPRCPSSQHKIGVQAQDTVISLYSIEATHMFTLDIASETNDGIWTQFRPIRTLHPGHAFALCERTNWQ